MSSNIESSDMDGLKSNEECEELFQSYFSKFSIEDNIRHFYCSQESVKRLVKSFISEPDSAVIHAQNCKKIISFLKTPKKESSNKYNFEYNLKNECQEQFEKLLKTINQKETPEVQSKKPEKFDNRLQISTNGIGTVKLIGELFKCKIISLNTINTCLKLLINPRYLCEDILNCLYVLLTIVGKKIESKIGSIEMNKYMRPLDNLFQDNRNTFSEPMLHIMYDISILSRNNWDQKNPDPIKEAVKTSTKIQKTDIKNNDLLKEEEKTRRIIKSIETNLNYLTNNNLKYIFEKIKAHKLNNVAINKCAELVFEKATRYPDSSQICAKLCHELALLYGSTLEHVYLSSFNIHLLNLCLNESHEVNRPENKFAVGTFKFIGELYNVDLISKNGIYVYKNMMLLPENVSDLTIECFCELLLKVGRNLVKVDGYISIEENLKTLESILESQSINLQKNVQILIANLLKTAKIWEKETAHSTVGSKIEGTYRKSVNNNAPIHQKLQKSDMNSSCHQQQHVSVLRQN